MTFFDFIVLAIVAASIVAGALRGLVRVLIASGSLVIGIIVAARGYEIVGTILRKLGLIGSSTAANAGGFLLIVGATLALGFIVGGLMRGSLRRARLEWFDRALGGAFGFFRGMAICSIIYLALTAFPLRFSSVAEARSAPVLAEGARLLAVLASSDVQARFLAEYKRLTT